MTAVMRAVLLVLSAWFALALAGVAAWNVAKGAVRSLRRRAYLAELERELAALRATQ